MLGRSPVPQESLLFLPPCLGPCCVLSQNSSSPLPTPLLLASCRQSLGLHTVLPPGGLLAPSPLSSSLEAWDSAQCLDMGSHSGLNAHSFIPSFV